MGRTPALLCRAAVSPIAADKRTATAAKAAHAGECALQVLMFVRRVPRGYSEYPVSTQSTRWDTVPGGIPSQCTRVPDVRIKALMRIRSISSVSMGYSE